MIDLPIGIGTGVIIWETFAKPSTKCSDDGSAVQVAHLLVTFHYFKHTQSCVRKKKVPLFCKT
jgi:hypothetical protein